MFDFKKILIVDDEEHIRQFTKINLEFSGYNIVEADTGEKAIALANSELPAVVVLDIMLPGISGFEVCKKLREDLPNIGIIMVTAKSQDIDKIMGLEQGTDDYMLKPFNPQELILRIKSLIRRMKIVDNEVVEKKVITDGIFKLDLYSRTFYKSDKEIDVTPTEFAILKLFLENKGKAMSRNEIMDMAWGENYSSDMKIIDVNIRRIRTKIEENPAKPQYLETVWGMGYRWVK